MNKIVLINSNRMSPTIGPIALDYIGASINNAGYGVDLIDLCLESDPEKALKDYFTENNPLLAGVTFRNADDCFWPQAGYFIPGLNTLVSKIKKLTDAPVVLGGCGYSIFPERLLELTRADYGIFGDGETALLKLVEELEGEGRPDRVPGLVYRKNDSVIRNTPFRSEIISFPTDRNLINNVEYFKRGGQAGIETKRGCFRNCLYCVEPLIKGSRIRLRSPVEVAEEAETLLSMDIDVVHICDSEFNLPRNHAIEICNEFINRKIGDRLIWYAYLSVTPFDSELACTMKKAGCVGINFTTDSACPQILNHYRQNHSPEKVEEAVRLCRRNNITVMLDLLFGGPGETIETVSESINFFRKIEPDCAGTSYGIRIYPKTGMEEVMRSEGEPDDNPNIKRKYKGPVDLIKPTFYISKKIGENPAALIRECIKGDERFFEPADETESGRDHNYNENTKLADAISKGARGAYWDILRKRN